MPSPGTPSCIDVTDADLARIANETWLALQTANTPPSMFWHASGLAQIERDSEGLPFIRTLDQDRLRHRLARITKWTKRRSGGLVSTFPPLDLVKDLLAGPEPPLPVLKQLTYSPYFTASGSLRLKPGYDPESRLFYEPRDSLHPLEVPSNPRRDDVRKAMEVIEDLIVDFPFVTQADRAHAIGVLLLPFIEQLIPGQLPAHGIEKPVSGSGGGLLMDALLWPALGGPAPKMTEPGDEAEWRRTIFAKLLHGSPVIGIDNVRQELNSAALASALTEAVMEDRVIRCSRLVQVSTRRIWVIVGNNLHLSYEIARRTIRIRIDPGIEHPEHRCNFRHPHLRLWLAEHRARLVQAALTVCQAWVVAGRPMGCRTIGSFESWAQVVGGILEVAEVAGFLENLNAVSQNADPQEVAWAALFDRWGQQFGNRELGASELWLWLVESPDILIGLGLGDRGDNSQKTQLGLGLNQRRDRVYAGRRLMRAGSARGANRWRLVD